MDIPITSSQESLHLKSSAMEKPDVTIVAVPRERFDCVPESLESIFQDTGYPFKLVYVDGGSPPYIQRYLEEKAKEKQFKLLRTDYYLSANRAKNLGLCEVKTKYVVFIDNDVVVKRGWLEKLVQCAEETGAAVVGPLTCISRPKHEIIHNAGGEAHIELEVKGDLSRRRFHQKPYLSGKLVSEVSEQLHRIQCEYVEFHCILVRTDIFERTGSFDEEMLSTNEHLDFCMSVSEVGSSIYCEREAIVTTDALAVSKRQAKFPRPKFKPSDIPFFMLRWSDAWDIASVEHFAKKWDLTEDKVFLGKRYKKVGRQRHEAFVKPLSRRLSFGLDNPWLEKILISIEKQLNRYITERYAHSQARRDKELASKQPEYLATLSLPN